MQIGLYLWSRHLILVAVCCLCLVGSMPVTQAGDVPLPVGLSTGDGSWFWEHPRPQGNDLWSIDCLSSGTCITTGDAGTMLRFDGSTWFSHTDVLTNNHTLISIDCPSDWCVAISNQGAIIEYDAIARTSVVSQTTTYLYDVTCFSDMYCVAVGFGVFFEYDGTSWTQIYLPQVHEGTTALVGVSCPAIDLCFGVGSSGLIMKYDGSTWTTETVPGYVEYVNLNGIDCASVQMCVAVGGNIAVGGFSDQGLSMHYDGSTWSDQTIDPTKPLFGIDCSSPTFCVAGSLGFLFEFTGAWNIITAPVNTAYNAVHCSATMHCWVVGQHGTILERFNGQWSGQSQAETVGYIYGIDCTFVETCFASDLNRGLLKLSPTHGWEAVSSGVLSKLFDIECASANVCFALGFDGALFSYNGSSWAAVNSSVASTLLNIECTSTTRCVAVGVNGTTVVYNGSTWSSVASGVSATLYDVICEMTCRAVGTDGTILVSDAGVTTWTAEDSSTTEVLHGITCRSDSECWAVGEKRTIVAYNGTTWSHVQSSTHGILYDADCGADGTCYIVGSSGTVLELTDETWTAHRAGTYVDLYHVSCDNECRIGGQYGAILREALAASVELQVTPLTGNELTMFTAVATISTAESLSPTGSVSFFVDGVLKDTVTISGTTARYSTQLPVGTHTFEARYNGDDLFRVAQAQPVIIMAEAVEIYNFYLPTIRK